MAIVGRIRRALDTPGASFPSQDAKGHSEDAEKAAVGPVIVTPSVITYFEMNRDEIIAFLKEYKAGHADRYGIVSMGLFGSVARGEVREDSDIDIYIKTRTPNPFALVHIKNDIEQRLHRHVDIIRFRDKMNPVLKKRIEREGVLV